MPVSFGAPTVSDSAGERFNEKRNETVFMMVEGLQKEIDSSGGLTEISRAVSALARRTFEADLGRKHQLESLADSMNLETEAIKRELNESRVEANEKINNLTIRVDQLTGQVNSLSTQFITLSGHINGQVDHINNQVNLMQSAMEQQTTSTNSMQSKLDQVITMLMVRRSRHYHKPSEIDVHHLGPLMVVEFSVEFLCISSWNPYRSTSLP